MDAEILQEMKEAAHAAGGAEWAHLGLGEVVDVDADRPIAMFRGIPGEEASMRDARATHAACSDPERVIELVDAYEAAREASERYERLWKELVRQQEQTQQQARKAGARVAAAERRIEALRECLVEVRAAADDKQDDLNTYWVADKCRTALEADDGRKPEGQ